MEEQIEQEQKELDLLNKVGMKFEVPRRYTARLSKSKTRTFHIQSPCLGVMDRLSAQYIKLDMDDELLKQDALLEAKKLVRRHAWTCAKIVAIAVLGHTPFYRLVVGVLTSYFFMRVDAATMFRLTAIINHMNNYADFIHSIRYLSSARTTKPQLIEEPSQQD